MQSSRSHTSLRDLPLGLESLNLNTRTASSTPAPRNKLETSLSRSSMLTPPIDASASDPFLVNRASSKDRSMHLESKAEDDVFGGAKLPVDIQPRTSTNLPDVVGHTSPSAKITPRSDRLSGPITPQNAQGVLPPEALVFVANLSVNRTDDQLEESVYSAFHNWGECIVKVRRDRNKHPFALVQYYTVGDADAALEGSRDLVIDDRKVRTERAQARREYIVQNGDTGSSYGSGSVVLSRTSGGPISKEEAESLLGQFGPIQEMFPTTHADARLHGTPEGMWVKFAYYLDSKDALKLFNNSSSLFKITEPPHLEPRVRPNLVSSSSPIVHSVQTPRSTTDQKSIFVGNLPPGVAEEELKEIFSVYGRVMDANVIRKQIIGGPGGFNHFGFVEFSNVVEAGIAAEAEMEIRGKRVRIEPKEYSSRRYNRMQSNGPNYTERSRGIHWGSSPNSYQPPTPLPYGFHPIYMQPPPVSYSPYSQAYNWNATPPSSGQRRRPPPADEFLLQGSPHTPQYMPIAHPAYAALAQFPGDEGEEHHHATRRYN